MALLAASSLSAQARDEEQPMNDQTIRSQQQEQGINQADTRARMRSVTVQNEDEANEQHELLREASATYRKVVTDAEQASKREEIARNAQCVAVFPEMTETALVVGRKTSDGVATCKTAQGGWSAVSFVEVSGTSLGAQLGREKSSMVLFFTDQEAKQKLIDGDTSLGNDLSLAVGITDYSVDTSSAQVVALSDQSGGKIGVSIGGTTLRPDEESNEEFYNGQMTHRDALQMAHTQASSSAGQQLIQMLPNPQA